MKNILVGIDFEDKYELLVDKALEYSKYEKAKIWLLHASAPDPDFVGFEGGPQFIRDVRADELKREHVKLQELISKVEAAGAETDALLIIGATIQVILEESVKLNVDLIIVGHQRHGFFYNLFFGHQDYDVIKKSRVPVLVIPLGV
jgi:nucleotide-binding universal stress UspA family protein